MTDHVKKIVEGLKHCATVDCDSCPFEGDENCATKVMDAAHMLLENGKTEDVLDSMKIAPPWIQYVNKLKALFAEDKQVRVEYNDDSRVVKLYVDDFAKSDALYLLLPSYVKFGDVELEIEVIPANGANMDYASLFAAAFKNNPAVADMITIGDVFANPLTYIMFKKEVVQFYNDDLSDPHGNCSTLYQNIADEIFKEHDGVFFCTNTDAE